MAKIRIYELARDLNMTNKTLLDKLRDMDIPVKTHMSSLEENEVDQIKRHLLGKPEKEIEITRIKPTIIRRRRKKVKQEPIRIDVTTEEEAQKEADEVVGEPSKAAPADEQPVPAETDRIEAEPIDAKEDIKDGEPLKEDVSEVADTPAQSLKVVGAKKKKAEEKEVKTAKPKKKVKKVKKETPAKIIKLAVVPPTPEKETEPKKVKQKRPRKVPAKKSSPSGPTASAPEVPNSV